MALAIAAALGFAGWLTIHLLSDPTPTDLAPAIRPPQDILTMHKTGGQLVGKQLVDRYPGKSALLLLPPEQVTTPTDEALIHGITRVAADKLAIQPARMTIPEETTVTAGGLWLTAEAFDQAINRHPDADVVVSIAGLPVNAAKLTFWHKPDRPDLILLNTPVFDLQRMIATGAVDAVLVRRPWLPGDPQDQTPVDPHHWLLITSTNVADIARRYKGIFYEE